MNRNKRTLFLLLTVLTLVACSGLPRLGGSDSPLARVTVPASVSEQADILATQAASVAATAAAGATAVAASAETDSVVATVAAQGEAVAGTVQSSMDLDALRERFSSAQPDENGNVSVTLTDAELNQVIQASQEAAAQAGRNVQIENAQASFTGGNIIVTGNVTEPLTAALNVTFRPYVANNTLQFEVVNATVGGITVPPTLLQSAEATLNSTLGEAMNNLPAQFVLQDVIMSEGTMTVVGRQA